MHLFTHFLESRGQFLVHSVTARRLKLFGRDADVFHVAAQHQVHQVLEFVVDFAVLFSVLIRRFKNCAKKSGPFL